MRNFIYRYKYLPDMNGVVGVIKEGTIKFTHPKNFNDPFDCMPSMKFGSYSKMKERNPEMYQATIGGISNPVARLKVQQKMLGAMKSKVLSGEVLDLMMSEASVLSLSKIPDSILMWSHYAGFHKGAVVEFKIPVDIFYEDFESAAFNLLALDVVYSKVRPVLEYNADPSDANTILNTMFMTKSDVWSYEQESRVLRRDGGGGIIPYNQKLLSSVIVGPRNENFNKILQMTRATSALVGNRIDVFKAEFCNKNYELKIPKFRRKKDS